MQGCIPVLIHPQQTDIAPHLGNPEVGCPFSVGRFRLPVIPTDLLCAAADRGHARSGVNARNGIRTALERLRNHPQRPKGRCHKRTRSTQNGQERIDNSIGSTFHVAQTGQRAVEEDDVSCLQPEGLQTERDFMLCHKNNHGPLAPARYGGKGPGGEGYSSPRILRLSR